MLKEKIKQVKADPGMAIRVVLALTRGFVIKAFYALCSPKISIGSNFRAYTWISIRGPGSVKIGQNVSIDQSFQRNPTILTHLRSSKVIIGDGCYLGGTRISCVTSVQIGQEALLGSSTIIDSDIIPSRGSIMDTTWVEMHARPILIGNHFWSGTNSFILGGTFVGEECVLAAGATIQNKDVMDKSLLLGNPARKIGQTRR